MQRSAATMLALCTLMRIVPALAQAAGALPPPGSPPEHGPQRPPLFFREEWKQAPKGGEHPVTGASLSNPNLELTLLVPAGQIMLAGNPGDENNPTHVWLGLCATPCGLAFRNRRNLADLTGLARIRWSTRTSGYHQIRPVVKLADGTWLVADRTDGSPRDWLVSEISFADLHWLKLDTARVVTTGTPLDHVDLSKVDAVGFADLMPGSGHGPGGWSDLAQVELYARAVPR
ncbi:MAG TPA: hypothetical protein VMC02_10170 [Steroidobacteraceae bacterium]|nr:hypothetical protein [Steroidobacteraceae bacterium]